MAAFLADAFSYLGLVILVAIAAYLIPKLIAAGVLRAYQEYLDRVGSDEGGDNVRR